MQQVVPNSFASLAAGERSETLVSERQALVPPIDSSFRGGGATGKISNQDHLETAEERPCHRLVEAVCSAGVAPIR
jgi:hypothetical protein